MERGRVVAGKYKIERPLAAGGMGSVWIAEQQPIGRNVAFKVLKFPPGSSQRSSPSGPSEAAEARFFREMQALGRINAHNVVAVYDSGRTEDGSLYIAMELVDGPTLRQELDTRGRMPAPAALDVIRQITAGLAAAHDQKIAHLDLKPENVVLHRATSGREAKILDFGIARVVEKDAAPEAATEGAGTVTEEGVAVGTPGYMSPEQLLGVRDDVRSDLYALGVIWFELVTGRRLFQGATTAEVASKTLTETPPRPNDVVAGCIDDATDAVIAQLLARDPNARPKNAGELLRTIDALTSSAAPTATSTIVRPIAGPPSPAPVTATTPAAGVPIAGPPPRTRTRVAAIGALLVLVSALVAAVGLWRGTRPPQPLKLAVLGFEEPGQDQTMARIVRDTLAHSLAAVHGVRVVSPLIVAHALVEQHDDALAAAAAVHADLVITGVVKEAPGTIHVDAQLHDLRAGDAGGAVIADGKDAEGVVFDLVPKLSRELATVVGEPETLSETAVASTVPVMMSTHSNEAYASFLNAERTVAHDLRGARAYLEDAVAKEPTSPTPRMHLALVRAAIGGRFDDPSVKDALDGIDRAKLPVYEQRIYSVVEPLSRADHGAALLAAQSINSEDPDDPMFWALLANAWLPDHPEKAINCLKQATKRTDDIGMVQIQLAGLLAQTGDKPAAVATLKPYVDRHPEDAAAVDMLKSLL